jgi:hypothetical protein
MTDRSGVRFAAEVVGPIQVCGGISTRTRLLAGARIAASNSETTNIIDAKRDCLASRTCLPRAAKRFF